MTSAGLRKTDADSYRHVDSPSCIICTLRVFSYVVVWVILVIKSNSCSVIGPGYLVIHREKQSVSDE